MYGYCLVLFVGQLLSSPVATFQRFCFYPSCIAVINCSVLLFACFFYFSCETGVMSVIYMCTFESQTLVKLNIGKVMAAC